MGSYWDYGNDESLWLKTFLKYMTVMVALFWSTVGPPITLALANLYCKFLDLVKVYR